MTMFDKNSFFNDKSFSISEVNEIKVTSFILERKQADKPQYSVADLGPTQLQGPRKANYSPHYSVFILLSLSVCLTLKLSKVFKSMRSLLS